MCSTGAQRALREPVGSPACSKQRAVLLTRSRMPIECLTLQHVGWTEVRSTEAAQPVRAQYWKICTDHAPSTTNSPDDRRSEAERE